MISIMPEVAHAKVAHNRILIFTGL